MKGTLAICLLMLAGCATTITDTRYRVDVPPDVPTEKQILHVEADVPRLQVIVNPINAVTGVFEWFETLRSQTDSESVD